MPVTFEALKSQRYRWCLGGIQILRMHWRSMRPRRAPAHRVAAGPPRTWCGPRRDHGRDARGHRHRRRAAVDPQLGARPAAASGRAGPGQGHAGRVAGPVRQPVPRWLTGWLAELWAERDRQQSGSTGASPTTTPGPSESAPTTTVPPTTSPGPATTTP